MEDNEIQYTHGFNSGYVIAKHEPELYATITNGLESKNEYIEGFVLGGREYEHEKNAPEKSNEHDAKGRDKGIEHDR